MPPSSERDMIMRYETETQARTALVIKVGRCLALIMDLIFLLLHSQSVSGFHNLNLLPASKTRAAVQISLLRSTFSDTGTF